MFIKVYFNFFYKMFKIIKIFYFLIINKNINTFLLFSYIILYYIFKNLLLLKMFFKKITYLS